MSRSSERLRIPGYQVVDYLGSGARSTIWRVRDRDRNRFYALKRVYKNPEDDGRYLAQAINEFRIARRLDHPTIRKCIRLRRLWKWFRVHELHLFMKLCEGATCQANRPTEVPKVIEVFGQVGQALAGQLAILAPVRRLGQIERVYASGGHPSSVAGVRRRDKAPNRISFARRIFARGATAGERRRSRARAGEPT